MIARLGLAVAMAIALAGCSHHEDHHGPATSSGYAGLQDSPIRGLTPAQIDELRSGSGMQLALPAELNGFPGPKHVLDLSKELQLNASQRAAVQQLYNSTNAQARTAGEAVLDAYEALDQWFREGAGESSELEALLATLADREADLRKVHLDAHIACKSLLTAHQVELYKDLRGYGGTHTGHDH